MIKFKPMLLPNDSAGETIDWSTRIKDHGDWMYSIKDDGVRMEIYSDGTVLGRSLKPVPSKYVQGMAKHFVKNYAFNGVVEAELYGEGFTLPEIVHFSRCEDVEDLKYRKKWDAEWAKTEQGTTTYTKTVKGQEVEVEWQFPGRTPEWLCTWPRELKFQIFGCFPYDNPMATMEERYGYLQRMRVTEDKDKPWVLVKQYNLQHLGFIEEAFNQVTEHNREGLVLMHRGMAYKQGRITLNEGIGYKYKETNIEFTCTILDVPEATEAIDGAPKTINELGRSVTSKLAEDRRPAGYAKGFYVLLADGQKMTVSLNGYTIPDKQLLLKNKQAVIGKVITCTGMKPVKVGGVPRSSHYTKGYVSKSKV